jgi:hypothetical protein
MLFEGNKRVDDLVVSGLPGLSGIATEEGGNYTLLLINETGNEMVIPSVKVNNAAVQNRNYSITSVSASSLESESVKWYTGEQFIYQAERVFREHHSILRRAIWK